jgi:PAS domain S-box-containing protein
MGVQDLDLDFPLESADGVADHVTDTRDADRPSVYDSGSHRRRNGTSFPVEVALARRKFGDRQYMLVVARDVNRRHRTEQALRESEDKYRSLFDLSRDGIYLTARDGTVSDVNDSAIDLFGYTRAEFIGLEARKLYKNPGDIREFQKVVQEQGAARDLEIEFLTNLGQTFKGYLAATLRTDGDGNIQGYQCIVSPLRQRARIADKGEADEEIDESAEQPVDDRNTVVVAGKDRWVIDDTRAVLERAGVEVLSARTAAAAVELVRSQPDEVGVAVLDFPTDDPEFQRAVREIRQLGAGIRVIMFESETGSGDQSLWADAVVRKPLHPLALAQQVRESLSAIPRPDLDS